eukprot:351346-Chlamydomonas_euryale.AAC.7
MGWKSANCSVKMHWACLQESRCIHAAWDAWIKKGRQAEEDGRGEGDGGWKWTTGQVQPTRGSATSDAYHLSNIYLPDVESRV